MVAEGDERQPAVLGEPAPAVAAARCCGAAILRRGLTCHVRIIHCTLTTPVL